MFFTDTDQSRIHMLYLNIPGPLGNKTRWTFLNPAWKTEDGVLGEVLPGTLPVVA